MWHDRGDGPRERISKAAMRAAEGERPDSGDWGRERTRRVGGGAAVGERTPPKPRRAFLPTRRRDARPPSSSGSSLVLILVQLAAICTAAFVAVKCVSACEVASSQPEVEREAGLLTGPLRRQ